MESQQKRQFGQSAGGATDAAVRIAGLTARQPFPPHATGAAGLHLQPCNGKGAQ